MPIAVLFMHFHYDTKQGIVISVLHLTHSKRIDNIVWLCRLQVGLFHLFFFSEHDGGTDWERLSGELYRPILIRSTTAADDQNCFSHGCPYIVFVRPALKKRSHLICIVTLHAYINMRNTKLLPFCTPK